MTFPVYICLLFARLIENKIGQILWPEYASLPFFNVIKQKKINWTVDDIYTVGYGILSSLFDDSQEMNYPWTYFVWRCDFFLLRRIYTIFKLDNFSPFHFMGRTAMNSLFISHQKHFSRKKNWSYFSTFSIQEDWFCCRPKRSMGIEKQRRV